LVRATATVEDIMDHIVDPTGDPKPVKK